MHCLIGKMSHNARERNLVIIIITSKFWLIFPIRQCIICEIKNAIGISCKITIRSLIWKFDSFSPSDNASLQVLNFSSSERICRLETTFFMMHWLIGKVSQNLSYVLLLGSYYMWFPKIALATATHFPYQSMHHYKYWISVVLKESVDWKQPFLWCIDW